MKFGIDFASDAMPARSVRTVAPVASQRRLSAFPELDHLVAYNEPVLAIELLNSTLSRLNSLQILKAREGSNLRRERLNSLYELSKTRNNYITSIVDREVSMEKKLHEHEVKKIIEQREKLRREEAERQRLAREEKERKEREEEARQKRIEQERLKKQEEEARKKQEEEKKKHEEEKRLADEKKQKEEKEKAAALQKLKERLQKAKEEAAKKSNGLTNKAQVEKDLLKYRQDIQDIKQNVVEEMDKNKDMKKNANVIKRKLNVKFGQLSSSMSQLNSISREVIDLVNYTKQNELAYKWILNFVSKAIVAQAEAEVTVKPTAALPLARLAIHLLNSLDGLYYFLCARFAKKCALIVGYTCSIETEEGRVRMGWKRSDQKWEPEVKYEERIGGIATVWSVMARLGQEKIFPFFSMEAEWRFMARMLNTETTLIGNVHYVVFCNWWEAAAAQLAQTYGKQALKGLQLAVGDWAAYGKLKSYPAATRLIILGEDYASTRSFNLIKEMDT